MYLKGNQCRYRKQLTLPEAVSSVFNVNRSTETHFRVHSLTQRVADLTAIVGLVTVTIVAWLTFRDYGLGWDDRAHAEYGNLLVEYFGSGFTDRRAMSFVNLYMYGGSFDMLAALAAKVSPFDLFETRRLLGAIIGLIGLFATWRLGRRLGGPVAGAIAMILLALCPLYYGHMFMNPKDGPFAAAMAILILALVRAFHEYPRPMARTLALTGVGLGLAVGTRIIGGIASFYTIGAMIALLVIESRALGIRTASARLGRFTLALVPAALLAYLIMAVVWPWSVLSPFNPLRAAEYFSHFFEVPWRELFDGVALLVPNMPRSYVPTLFALKLPEILLLLGAAGTAAGLLAVFRRQLAAPDRAARMLVAIAATLPIAITVVMRPAMYNGIRHFVFVTPPLAALGGLAGAWLLKWAHQVGRPAFLATMAAIVALAMLPAVDMIRLHPYQYTHFNHLFGGMRAAEEHYMIDYWGLAFKQAAQQLRLKAKPVGHRWRVFVCGPQHTAQIELGPDFVTSGDIKSADFVLNLGEFYCHDLNGPVFVEVARENVVYARIYDMRSRSVSGRYENQPLQ
jgi:hypothetical protein